MNFLLLLLLSALLVSQTSAFYLPGIAPKDFVEGDQVPLHVNALQAVKSVLPYDFYNERFHFCKPEKVQDDGESLGSVLLGDRLKSSAFDLRMLKNETCKRLCGPQVVPPQDAIFMSARIREGYFLQWEIDGLPVGYQPENQKHIATGFPLGGVESGATVVNNFYHITVFYHTYDKVFRVVGAKVEPSSRKLSDESGDKLKCNVAEPVVLDGKTASTINYAYAVSFVPSLQPWGTRWDIYLTQSEDSKIHYFNLVNSIVIALFLTGMVAVILLRALHKDISRYNQVESQEEAVEEFGWKLVHGDVFRTPSRFQLLAVFLGSGAQIFMMSSTTMVFAVLGFLSPSNRGAMMTAILVSYVLFGWVAGYVSARFYKMFGGENWKRNVLLTAFLVPGLIFLVFTVLNFFLIGAESSAAVPFGTMAALITLWFLVSVPLCFLGAYFAFKKVRVEHPVRTNQIPRQIPEQPFFLRPWPSILMGGVLPFGAVFIELFFIMGSIWLHQSYYVFGILFFVSLVLIITCAEVTILMAYFQLCAENYHWWWRAFLTSGASALYVFLYSALYYGTRVLVDNVPSTFLYFGWSLVMSFMFFLFTGTVGFVACLIFVRKIYGSIKID